MRDRTQPQTPWSGGNTSAGLPPARRAREDSTTDVMERRNSSSGLRPARRTREDQPQTPWRGDKRRLGFVQCGVRGGVPIPQTPWRGGTRRLGFVQAAYGKGGNHKRHGAAKETSAGLRPERRDREDPTTVRINHRRQGAAQSRDEVQWCW